MATPDLLFNLRNLFYLGAYQAAINNSDVPGLDADAAAERDAIVFRSYIALGSYQVRSSWFGAWSKPHSSRRVFALVWT
jgi:coatomer protein complex subunit epsilon